MVLTRVVEEREWADGELVEVSNNFFAICRKTNSVFYFGEDVDIYEDGEIVSHEGAWRAGVNGAMPGIIMPGTFLLGSRYFQEIAPGVAMDRGENVEMGLEMETEAGLFCGCVKVLETTPLEPDAESEKIYCPGIGLVVDDEVRIVKQARDYLEHSGFRVVEAGDGKTALALARQARPDLVVLDLNLPAMDGLDVCRALRRESDVPIIMLTARVEDADKIIGLELGADDYITKPFNAREIVARVRALLPRVQFGTGPSPQLLRAG